MKMSKIISFVMFFLFSSMPQYSFANTVVWDVNGIYEIGSGKEWWNITNLTTHNNVIVKMYEGGGVSYFWMYDNSEFTMYEGSVNYLYLNDNATASYFAGAGPFNIDINSVSTAQVKLYAEFDHFEPYDPYNDPLGPGNVYGYWLSNDMSFNINLVGQGAFSHIQFIPEPATLFLLGLGGMILRKRKA